jgi:inosine-uridine nucleoside N-ribohydrolase
MTKARPIVLDTDPGHDDAIAMLLAAASEQIDVRGVTTVHGNHVLEKMTRNALQVLEVAERTDIPVAAGMARPMVREQLVTEDVHGESGLEGPDLEAPTSTPVDGHGVDFLIETARDHEALTLVPVGPLSNVGMALKKAPDITEHIDEVVPMGGALGAGNQTPSAEFNILADAEAADIVFESGLPITMVGLDATHNAVLPADRFEEIRAFDSPVGTMVADLLEFFGKFYRDRYDIDGVVIHDALAVAAVAEPGVLETESMSVCVDTAGEHTYGRTVCDKYGVTEAEPRVEVGVGVDTDRFFELLFEALERY